MKRILVPTDFSEASRIAVGHAVEVAEAVGAELLLLHVVDEAHMGSAQLAGLREVFTMTIDPTGNAFSYEIPHDADVQSLCEEAEWKLAALLPPLRSDRLRTLVVGGHRAAEKVRVAPAGPTKNNKKGHKGQRGGRRRQLDYVSEMVIQRSAVPVMTLWAPRGATADRGRAHDLVCTD